MLSAHLGPHSITSAGQRSLPSRVQDVFYDAAALQSLATIADDSSSAPPSSSHKSARSRGDGPDKSASSQVTASSGVTAISGDNAGPGTTAQPALSGSAHSVSIGTLPGAVTGAGVSGSGSGVSLGAGSGLSEGASAASVASAARPPLSSTQVAPPSATQVAPLSAAQVAADWQECAAGAAALVSLQSDSVPLDVHLGNMASMAEEWHDAQSPTSSNTGTHLDTA